MKYKKKLKNPITPSAANVRRWIFLNLPKMRKEAELNAKLTDNYVDARFTDYFGNTLNKFFGENVFDNYGEYYFRFYSWLNCNNYLTKKQVDEYWRYYLLETPIDFSGTERQNEKMLGNIKTDIYKQIGYHEDFLSSDGLRAQQKLRKRETGYRLNPKINLNMKKKTKTQKKRVRKKNPIDYKFLEEIGINTPMGLPEDSKLAFDLGEMFGLERMILLCEAQITGSFPADLAKMSLILRKVKSRFDANALAFTEEGLPSDAFMLGVYQGIIKGDKLCLSGKHNIKIRQDVYNNIRNSMLYDRYSSPKNISAPRKIPFWKSYFGLDTGAK